MDKKGTQPGLKKVSCCIEEVKRISNNADFTKLQEQLNKSENVNIVYILIQTEIFSNYTAQKENIVFQVPKRDMPVQYSRLLI